MIRSPIQAAPAAFTNAAQPVSVEMLPGPAIVELVGVVGRVVGGPGDLETKRRRLLAGVGRIIGADGWLAAVSGAGTRGSGNLVENAEGDLEGCALTGDSGAVALAAMFFREFSAGVGHQPGGELAMVPEPVFRGSGVAARWSASGVVDAMVFHGSLAAGGDVAVVFLRCRGGEPFADSDRAVAGIVLPQVSWARPGCRPSQPSPASGLGPRQREVLEHLGRGESRKEIAYRLGISIHTVSGYCKELYRHFGVRSQAELVYRLGCGRVSREGVATGNSRRPGAAA